MPILSIITINDNNLIGLKRTVGSAINPTWQEFLNLLKTFFI